MALKDTVLNMKDLLMQMQCDLEKANRNNKVASQRVRTGSIQFAKVAKIYRKESIVELKKVKATLKKLLQKKQKRRRS